jgi:hypothetical protein
MAPPIQFGLGLSLARAGGAAFDADAAAYIAAVETAGATVSGGQKSAIDTFYKTGKSDGWYSSIKRLYLPIWASAAPNAIDMIALGSGTFNGTVTHGSGFVQSDGTTGWFDSGVTPGTLGLSPSTAYLCALAKTEMASATRAIGSRNSIAQDTGLARSSGNLLCQIMTNTLGSGLLATTANCSGILSGSRVDGTRFNSRRVSSQRTNLGSATDSDFGSVPTVNIGLMASNIVTTGASNFTDNEFGAFAIGTGLTDSEDSNFTLALKNLWEGTTGLTLP